MEGLQRSPSCTPPPALPIRSACRLLLIVALGSIPARADDNMYRNGFDDANNSWEVSSRSSGPTVGRHSRSLERHSGAAAEQFLFLSQQPVAPVEVSHALPPSRAFEDLAASLWVRCNCTGLRIGLQVRFPDQIDPRSGKPLVEVIPGDRYTSGGEWQQLTCRTTAAAMQELIRRLREELRQQSDYVPIDQHSVIAERVVVQLEVPAGRTVLALDELEFGPIVPPQEPPADEPGRRRAPLERQPRATIGDDQLLIDGRPEILLFTPYHGEGIDELARMRFNVAWIDRYDDAVLLDALKSVGMFAMANPLPREIPLEEALQPDLGLVSFSDETAQIAVWNMGSRLSPSQLSTQVELMKKVRLADAKYRRPILMDVMGAEREFHRHADMISSSRHILHTSAAPRDYLDLLRRKKKLALPNGPMYTLIQTEPADANLITRAEGRSMPIVEPEQIWMQGYAVLGAGYKGVGFWKLTSLTTSAPGDDERRLAISLFNAHVQLLQPWLASAKFMQMVPATVTSSRSVRDGGGGGNWRSKLLPARRSQPAEHERDSAEIQVAVFSCDQGRLLLPVWYEPNAQYQPGPMAADEISFVVSIGCENAQAWEVTTTSVTPLQNAIEKPGGGSLIRLTKFDQFAAIVLTQGDGPVQELKQRAFALQAACAREWIDLATAKIERVAEVHASLSAVAPISNADFTLESARRLVSQAEQELARRDYDGARQASRHALLLTRIVQRRHWERAVADADLTSGVSSPHTICFQTLPDHWQLVAEIGKRSHRDTNLLRSGDFEDADTFKAHGWWHGDGNDRRVRPFAELYGIGAAEGKRSLRLLAEPVDLSHPPEDVSDPPKRLISPPVPVYAGQIVHISGKVQLAGPVTANPDGLVIYESTKGIVGALRWREATPAKQWQSFQLIREINHSQDLTITIELRGLGDVRIDDLKVIAIEPE